MLEFAGLSSSQEEVEEVPGALEDPGNSEQKPSGVQCSQANHDEDSETVHETTATTEVKPTGFEIQERAPSDGISKEKQVKIEPEEKNKQDENSSQESTVQGETPQAKMKLELEEWSKSINDAVVAAGGRRGRILFPVL